MTSAELRLARQERWAGWLKGEASAAGLRTLIENAGWLPAAANPEAWPSLEAWQTASTVAAATARGWLAQLAGEREIAEVRLWPSGPYFVTGEMLADVCAWRGDRNPARDYRQDVAKGRLSPLAGEIYSILERGAQTPQRLRDELGAQRTSLPAVSRALNELAGTLRAVRIAFDEDEPVWQALHLAYPKATRTGLQRSRRSAAATMVAHYLQVAIVAEAGEIAQFLSPVMNRTATETALHALATARQIEADSLDGRPAFRGR
ncbi:MAG TPA: hypothetical protein VE996_04865 [Terriglobales bacterium]|nr:hypothetical protein [Terriglobales bacterium]